MIIYTKICSRCKITKPATDFNKDKSRKDELMVQCKICTRTREAEYRQTNKEQVNQRVKDYYYSHEEQIKEYRQANSERAKEWRLSNKERRYEYEKTKLSTDPLFALSKRVGNRLREALRLNGYTKKSRTYEILGCSYEEFKAHIESQFAEGMSWDNRDEWHLDHIKPLSSGTSEEEILTLNHYSNIQPLWAEDNLSKGSRYEEPLLVTHILAS